MAIPTRNFQVSVPAPSIRVARVRNHKEMQRSIEQQFGLEIVDQAGEPSDLLVFDSNVDIDDMINVQQQLATWGAASEAQRVIAEEHEFHTPKIFNQCSRILFDDVGALNAARFNKEDQHVSIPWLLDILNTPMRPAQQLDRLRQNLQQRTAGTEPIDWYLQVAYGQRYLARRLIDQKHSGEPV